MERPALQRLLADIRSGRIGIVVVYKVDRLARSLADFARLNLAFLSPKLVEAVLQGRQPVELTATRLTKLDLPIDWTEQNSLLAR